MLSLDVYHILPPIKSQAVNIPRNITKIFKFAQQYFFCNTVAISLLWNAVAITLLCNAVAVT